MRSPTTNPLRDVLRDLSGRRVAVLGTGRSGLAAAELALHMGAQITLYDERPAKDEVNAWGKKIQASGQPLTMTFGPFAAKNIHHDDLIVVSPGVPLLHPVLQDLAADGALLVSEIDLALAQVELPVLAVTGTNGKSTTTTMIGVMLQAGGLTPFVGGNLGDPPSAAVLSDKTYDCWVLELSSYQLELTHLLQPKVAVLTNLAPDHLDRYADAEAYYAAKRNIYRDLAVDGVLVARRQEREKDQLAGFDLTALRDFAVGQKDAHATPPLWACIQESTIWLRNDPHNAAALDMPIHVDNPVVRGRHNFENMTAALLTGQAMGLDQDQLQQGLRDYKGIAHRLEIIAEHQGVLYVNDSKGTNVDATVKALEAFDRPILLIAGGREKGTGFVELTQAARGRVRSLLSIGEAGPRIAQALKSVVQEHIAAQTLERAVQLAAAQANAGDVVLLSPACASFDQFANFEQRGAAFVQAVRAVIEAKNV